MTVRFREAGRADIAGIVALLSADELGRGREAPQLVPYLAAFEAMAAEPGNTIIVGEREGEIVATLQLTLISGLSRGGARRAQVEAVRVAAHLRGQGIGALLMAEAEARARAAGCVLMQFTSDASRERAHGFYARLGYRPTHLGFKRTLDF